MVSANRILINCDTISHSIYYIFISVYREVLFYVANIVWRKRSIPTHSGWLYPLTFDAGKGLKEA